jgi:outer membrane protein assembly factor BamA
LRLVGFVDAGLAAQQQPEQPNKPASDHLASVGLGLRYNTPALGISAEWGRIVTGSVLASQPNSTFPRAGDNKFHINLTARF